MTPDDVLIATERQLRAYARAKAQRRSLKRSFEIEDGRLHADETSARLALESIVAEHGPQRTMRGSVGRSLGWATVVDDEALLAWCEAHRPGVVAHKVTQKALTESGATWIDGSLTFDGEVVAGIGRDRKPSITVSLAAADPYGEDDLPDLESE